MTATAVVSRAVRSALGPHLLRPDFRARRPSAAPASWGCCYVAAEAVYHGAGGPASGLRPMFLRHENAPHWYLQDAQGAVIDPTADQFTSPPDYAQGRGKGFLTSKPSRRTRELMREAGITPCDT